MSAKKSIAHDIDRKAKSVLLSHTTQWATSSPEEDYGIDYVFELFGEYERGSAEASGIDFGVQLKGSAKLKATKNTVRSPSIGTDMLLYAVEKRRRPTFVVVIETDTSRGFWIDLNSIATPSILAKWRKQKTATISIPLENAISDYVRWKKAIVAADESSRGKWSTDPVQAIKYEKKKFEQQNPGIRAELLATEKGVEYKCYSDEPIQFGLTFKSKKGGVEEFVDRLIGSGDELNPADIGIKIEHRGLPLLESSLANSEFAAIRLLRKTAASVRLVVVDANASECGEIELHGELVGGSKHCEFQSSIADGGFAIRLDLSTSGFSINLNFSTAPWVGKSINSFGDLDRLQRLFSHYNDSSSIVCIIYMNGNEAGRQVIKPEDSALQEFAGVIDFISRLKKISNELGIDIVLPEESIPIDLSELEFIEDFLGGKQVSTTASDVSITADLKAGALSELNGASGKVCGIKASLPEPSFKARLLGSSIDLGPAVIHIPPTDFDYEILCENTPSPAIRMYSDAPIESVAVRVRPKSSK